VRTVRLLHRTEAIPKAATGPAAERPDAQRHFETMAVQKELVLAKELLVVDDLVTSGAALLGSANRRFETYPDIPIRGFAAMRTDSDPGRLISLIDPVVGEISLLRNGKARRRP
jgi:hypothetical protein